MKKGIKFRDSSVLNLSLAFNLLNLKYQHKMRQAKCILTLFQKNKVTEWNVSVKPTDNLSVFVNTYIRQMYIVVIKRFFLSVI